MADAIADPFESGRQEGTCPCLGASIVLQCVNARRDAEAACPSDGAIGETMLSGDRELGKRTSVHLCLGDEPPLAPEGLEEGPNFGLREVAGAAGGWQIEPSIGAAIEIPGVSGAKMHAKQRSLRSEPPFGKAIERRRRDGEGAHMLPGERGGAVASDLDQARRVQPSRHPIHGR